MYSRRGRRLRRRHAVVEVAKGASRSQASRLRADGATCSLPAGKPRLRRETEPAVAAGCDAPLCLKRSSFISHVGISAHIDLTAPAPLAHQSRGLAHRFAPATAAGLTTGPAARPWTATTGEQPTSQLSAHPPATPPAIDDRVRCRAGHRRGMGRDLLVEPAERRSAVVMRLGVSQMRTSSCQRTLCTDTGDLSDGTELGEDDAETRRTDDEKLPRRATLGLARRYVDCATQLGGQGG